MECRNCGTKLKKKDISFEIIEFDQREKLDIVIICPECDNRVWAYVDIDEMFDDLSDEEKEYAEIP